MVYLIISVKIAPQIAGMIYVHVMVYAPVWISVIGVEVRWHAVIVASGLLS